MKIVSCTRNNYSIQLNETFKTSLREINALQVFQIEIKDSLGRVGIGECVATPAIVGDDFDAFSSIFDVEIQPRILNGKISEIESLQVWPSIKSAVDCAFINMNNANSLVSVATDVTLPVCAPEKVESLVTKRLNQGFKTFKVKLDARSIKENLNQVRRIIECVPYDVRLRLDPNQAWESSYTIDFLEALKMISVNLEYIEQPVRANDIKGLASVKATGLYEVMADESCFSPEDALHLIENEACDWINIKLLKAGGVTTARKISNICKEAGMKISVGSMLESPLGVKASITFAHEVAPHITHDLDAAWWYENDVLQYVNGRVLPL